jgi:hypothetical protein
MGAVPTVAPVWSRPTTEAPASPAFPESTSTATPPTGAMVSALAAPVLSCTDATPLPTQTATQPTGPPSAVPKEPVPRTSTVVAEGADVEGSDTDPVPTALSVDSSTTSGSQLGVVVGGTRVVLPDPDVPGPVLPEPTGWSGGDTGTTVMAFGDDDPPVDPEALAVPGVLPVVCGTTIGSAHSVPVAHSGMVAGVVVGGHDTGELHPPGGVDPAV